MESPIETNTPPVQESIVWPKLVDADVSKEDRISGSLFGLAWVLLTIFYNNREMRLVVLSKDGEKGVFDLSMETTQNYLKNTIWKKL